MDKEAREAAQRMEEGTEHRKHVRAARKELHAIAIRLHQDLKGWEYDFDMVVGEVRLRRADLFIVSGSGKRSQELVNVEIEAGL